jgi:hypothetical protein
LFSPSFVYNLGNGGKDGGMTIASALNILENYGAATLDVMPYNQSDYKTQPGDKIKNLAWENRIASWQSIQGINAIKEAIMNYGGAIVGVPIYPEFDRINANNPIYDDTSGKVRGGHAICLVGWDNDLQAFKFINSWGTDWGINGFAWVSYEIATSNGYAYYMVDRREDSSSTKKIYDITFDLNGGSEYMQDIKIEEGVGQKLSHYNGSAEGSTFGGWFLAKEDKKGYLYYYRDSVTGQIGWYEADANPAGYKAYFVNDGADILLKDLDEGTYVLVASWTEDENSSKLTISFYPNGGYGYMTDLEIANGVVRLPNSSFANDGFAFDGWWMNAGDYYWHVSNGGSDGGWYQLYSAPSNYQLWIIEDGGSFEIDVEYDAVTLVARWKELEQITVYIGVYENDELKHVTRQLGIGDSLNLSDDLVAELEGKTFAGWSMYDMNKGKYKYESQGRVEWCAEGDEPSGYEMFMHQPNVSYEGFSQEHAGREFLMIPEYRQNTKRELLYYQYHVQAKIPDFINFGGGFKKTEATAIAGLLEVYAYVSTSDSESRKTAIDDYISALQANNYSKVTSSSDKWWSGFASKQYDLEKELFGNSLEVTAFVSDDGAVLISSYRNYVALALYSKEDKANAES